MLISVGASNEDEITRTLSLVRSVNDQPIALLHCVLEYPTPYEHANLNKITSLKKVTQKIQFTLTKWFSNPHWLFGSYEAGYLRRCDQNCI